MGDSDGEPSRLNDAPFFLLTQAVRVTVHCARKNEQSITQESVGCSGCTVKFQFRSGGRYVPTVPRPIPLSLSYSHIYFDCIISLAMQFVCTSRYCVVLLN